MRRCPWWIRQTTRWGRPVLQIDEPAVGGVHAESLGQPGGLIDTATSMCLIVYFLQGDDVGIERGEGDGRSFQIDGAVHASAVFDVVGGHSPHAAIVRNRWRFSLSGSIASRYSWYESIGTSDATKFNIHPGTS